MKWLLIGVIVVIGIFVIFVSVALTPLSQNLSEAANTTDSDVLGSNYTQFEGMPQLFAYWWILPVFFLAIMVVYAVYKVYKR